MTLPELLSKLTSSGRLDAILTTMYFQAHYEGRAVVTSENVRDAMKQARVPKASTINVTDYLSKAGGFVDSPGSQDGRRTWRLTETGTAHVLGLLGGIAPAVEEDISVLTKQITVLKDDDVRDYVVEAVSALQVGARRAAVVFLWVGAVRLIQAAVIAAGISSANAAIQKHYQKARTIQTIDDLQFVQESTLLLAARDLGVFDKGETQILEHCLDVRNKCGHPGKYKPGPKKLSSIIEDLISVVDSRD
jgi:hypothetical protein